MSTTTINRQVTCGNCRDTHINSAAVKDCYNATRNPVAIPAVNSLRFVVEDFTAQEPVRGTITDRQLSYLTDLLTHGSHAVTVPADLAALDRSEASTLISAVLAAQRETPEVSVATTPSAIPVQSQLQELPEGRYAVGTDANARFYQVTQKRSGSKVLRRLHGNPGNWRRSRVQYGAAGNVVSQIAEDPAAAMVRFGHLFGVCGRCVAPLSDPVSRERAIGPDCALTMGMQSHHDYAATRPHLASVY